MIEPGDPDFLPPKPIAELRRGWTTGACATAAAKAAYSALVSGDFPDPVNITLPNGSQPAFALAQHERGADWAMAGIIKDAGDDPDVTHCALICVTVRHAAIGSGVIFKAGEGVGMVTKAGLPVPPGEPAINPAPRAMIRAAIAEVVNQTGASGDVEVTISIPGGEALAQKTLNPRLGIIGGLSILGTTGIVIPFSCAAWIHSIHRGIDVARAEGLTHLAGATGSTSEDAIAALDHLPESALLDMGDFVGGMLKYIRAHPVERVTIAGGFAKMGKLSQGLLDLHSRAGAVDLDHLSQMARAAGAPPDFISAIPGANSALEVLQMAQARNIDIVTPVADAALVAALKVVRGTGILLDVVIFDRHGALLVRSAIRPG